MVLLLFFQVILPDQTVYMIDFDSKEEAFFLCALLNSSPVRMLYKAHTFKHVSMSFITNIFIPKFDASDPLHIRLYQFSELAHRTSDSEKILSIEAQIDKISSVIWGITEKELKYIQRELGND